MPKEYLTQGKKKILSLTKRKCSQISRKCSVCSISILNSKGGKEVKLITIIYFLKKHIIMILLLLMARSDSEKFLQCEKGLRLKL